VAEDDDEYGDEEFDMGDCDEGPITSIVDHKHL